MKNNKTRRMLIIGGIVVLAAMLSLSAVFLLGGKKQSSQSETYQDPYSGEVISNPANKTPETFGGDPNQAVFPGISKLLDYGVTTGQLTTLKAYLEQPEQVNQNGRPKVISTVVDTIQSQPYDPNSTAPAAVTFDVVYDNTSRYHARMEYSGLADIRLVLTDNNSRVVFDSSIGTSGHD